MRKFLKTIAALAVMVAAVGCVNDTLTEGITPDGAPTSDPISVRPYVPTATRGLALDSVQQMIANNIGFDLFAHAKTGESYDLFMGETDENGYISDGVEFKYNNGWDYANLGEMKFWADVADADHIDFYAISPANYKSEADTLHVAHANPTIEYLVPEAVDKQVDLMYAKTLGVTTTDAEGKKSDAVLNGISLSFHHALSQIIFNAKTESENIIADINAIEIDKVVGDGEFNIETEEWTFKEHNIPTKFSAGIAEKTDLKNELTALTTSANAMLLLPQTVEGTLMITCRLRYDTDLSSDQDALLNIYGRGDDKSGYTTLEVPFKAEWQKGYKYTYTLIFTADLAEPVKVDVVTVDAWNTTDEDSTILLPPTEDEGDQGDDDQGDNTYTPQGQGTESDPYLISTIADLEWIQAQVAADNTAGENKGVTYGKYFLQTQDIDLTEKYNSNGGLTWPGIGAKVSKFSSHDDDRYFVGNYNGAGHSIKIDIDATYSASVSKHAVGLFANVAKGAAISNLAVTGTLKYDTESQENIYVGALAGNCYGNIVACQSDVEITVTNQSSVNAPFIGGLCGYAAEGIVAASYASGKIFAADYSRTGGLFGEIFSTNLTADGCFQENYYSPVAPEDSQYNAYGGVDGQGDDENEADYDDVGFCHEVTDGYINWETATRRMNAMLTEAAPFATGYHYEQTSTSQPPVLVEGYAIDLNTTLLASAFCEYNVGSLKYPANTLSSVRGQNIQGPSFLQVSVPYMEGFYYGHDANQVGYLDLDEIAADNTEYLMTWVEQAHIRSLFNIKEFTDRQYLNTPFVDENNKYYRLPTEEEFLLIFPELQNVADIPFGDDEWSTTFLEDLTIGEQTINCESYYEHFADYDIAIRFFSEENSSQYAAYRYEVKTNSNGSKYTSVKIKALTDLTTHPEDQTGTVCEDSFWAEGYMEICFTHVTSFENKTHSYYKDTAFYLLASEEHVGSALIPSNENYTTLSLDNDSLQHLYVPIRMVHCDSEGKLLTADKRIEQ